MIQQHRFLVLEDDPGTARTLCRIFEAHGKVIVVNNLAEARLLCTEETHWSGACFDIGLPDGSGLDLLGELREQRAWFPVLVLTGFRDEAFVNRVQHLNAYFSLKPLRPEGLRAFASMAIESRRQPSSLELTLAQAEVEWGLTAQEARVLALALEGLGVEDIAKRLDRTHHTVIAHSRALRCKAGHLASLIDVVREILGRTHRAEHA